MKVFIAHSLHLLKEALELETFLKNSNPKITCYVPGRDTQQEKLVEVILAKNLEAIQISDKVYAIWDGLSHGLMFDLGSAYALGKPILFYSIKNKSSWPKFFENNIGCLLFGDGEYGG